MAIDIRRIRQQAVLAPNGPMDPSMGMPMDPSQFPPTGPTFPDQGVIDPGVRIPPEMAMPPAPPPPGAPSAYKAPTLEELFAQINKGYSPDFQSRDRYNEHIDTMPVRQPPGLARSIIAGGIGLRSKDPIKDMESVMYAPHNRAMDDWTAKNTPMSQAATQENTANANERALVGNVVTAHTASERLAEQGRIADEKNEVAQFRAQTYRLKTEIDKDRNRYSMNARGPFVTVFDKTTGKTTPTSIPTGWMSESEKIELEGQWDVKAAQERGANALENTTLRETQLLEDEQGRQWEYTPGQPIRPVQTDQTGAPPRSNQQVPPRQPTTPGQRPPVGQQTPPAQQIPGDTQDPSGRLNTVGPRRPQSTAKTIEEQALERQQLYRWIKQNYPQYQALFPERNGSVSFIERPTVDSGWFGWGAKTKQDVDDWDAANKLINPEYVPPAESVPQKSPQTPPAGSQNRPAASPIAPSGPPPELATARSKTSTGPGRTSPEFGTRTPPFLDPLPKDPKEGTGPGRTGPGFGTKTPSWAKSSPPAPPIANARPMPPSTAPFSETNQPVILYQNGDNTNHRVQSRDGGKTWYYSVDGGKTWSDQIPPEMAGGNAAVQ